MLAKTYGSRPPPQPLSLLLSPSPSSVAAASPSSSSSAIAAARSTARSAAAALAASGAAIAPPPPPPPPPPLPPVSAAVLPPHPPPLQPGVAATTTTTATEQQWYIDQELLIVAAICSTLISVTGLVMASMLCNWCFGRKRGRGRGGKNNSSGGGDGAASGFGADDDDEEQAKLNDYRPVPYGGADDSSRSSVRNGYTPNGSPSHDGGGGGSLASGDTASCSSTQKLTSVGKKNKKSISNLTQKSRHMQHFFSGFLSRFERHHNVDKYKMVSEQTMPPTNINQMSTTALEDNMAFAYQNEGLPPTRPPTQNQTEEDGSMWKGVRSLATKLIDATNDEEPLPEVEGVDYKLGKIQYAIGYDFRTLTLTVTIFRACQLPAKDFTGTSDPYVKVLLLPDKKHKLLTKVRKRNLNPHWNERFVFEDWPHHKLLEKTLYFQVIDYDRFSRDDPIGEITIPLNEVDLTQKKSTWRFLEPCKESRGKLGELLLSLCYQPAVGRLIIEVKKAKDLKAKDITGTSDPYVKMWLMHGNTRVEKRKTTIKRRTLNPIFEETFIFDISWEKIRESQIHVIVMDFDKLGRNELIGKLVLGSRSGPTEMKHWNDMVSKPRQPVLQWHLLKD